MTTSMMAMMLWPSTKTTDAATLQACFDSLAVFNPNTKSTGMNVMRPTLPAHRFLCCWRYWKTMAARCFHEVNGGGVKHGGRVRPWIAEYSSKVVLGV